LQQEIEVRHVERHSHSSLEGALGVEEMKGPAPHVRDDNSPARQDIQLAWIPEFAGTFAGAAELTEDAAIRADGDHVPGRVEEIQISGLVEACAPNRVQKLPVSDCAGRPDAVDIREFEDQSWSFPGSSMISWA